jgi:AcrR family transcriptional regulator
MSKKRLSKEAWIAAGFKSLANNGPASLQINLLAKSLDMTKGSFYWHFKDLAEYKAAMLDLWQVKVAREIIEEVMAEASPERRLDVLFENATRPAPEDYGGQKIEPAMRAWALSDDNVGKALKGIDMQRLAFLKVVLDDLGLNGGVLSELVYASYIGLDDLQSKGRVTMGDALSELKSLIITS